MASDEVPVNPYANFNPATAYGPEPQRLERIRLGLRKRALSETFFFANNICGFDKLIPETHGPLCEFLDTCAATRRLIQMPRSHFKSTIVTICHKLKLVLIDPTLRILIVGDTGPNAQKHLAKIKNQVETNQLLRWLFPDRIWADTSKAPAWSKEALFFPTDADGSLANHGEPTLDEIGAGGEVVSRHYNIINADDLIGEDEYYSETEMSKKIDWFSGIESLFVPPMEDTLMDIPSTYWRTDDIYAFAEEFYGQKKAKVKTGPFSYQVGELAVFRRGAIEDGQPIFPPEKGGYSLDFYSRLREKNPERYAAQYANNPKSAENAYFKPEFLRFYEVRSEDGKVLSVQKENAVDIVDTRNLVRYSFCDPHAGGTNKFRGSRAAVITTAIDIRYPRIYVLEAWIRRAATNLIIDEIYRQNEQWEPEIFSIEANGLQKMLKYWIDERAEREKLPEVPYRPYIPKGGKDEDGRIKGLQPLFRAGQIYMNRGFTELLEEYASWPRGLKDGIDALSQGLHYWCSGDVVTDDEYAEYEEDMRRERSLVTGY